ncbi:TerS protein [Burkholderia vietnamiensis]|uniref:TerS protein n=1 Tax=Burkholderia vietnamiensis TaxID=60552 RepID=UPI0009C0AA0B|nr:TerS protein [Burkholderia vietnamiensis]
MAKTRSDSVTAAVKAAQAASLGPIKPPAHVRLRDIDIPYWNSIVLARAADTWTDIDLAHAANLAHCQADINRIQEELENEKDIITNAKGTQVVNPKHALLNTLSVRSMALSAKLHVHAAATVGRSADASKKLKNEQEARKPVDTDLDDLVPRLRAVQ